MILLQLGGVVVASPSTLDIDHNFIVDGGRNAKGDLIADLITTKDKLNISWSYLTPTQLKEIRGLISAFYFSATYINPETDTTRTATFYAGSIKAGYAKYNVSTGLIEYYKDVTVNIIEK